MIVPYRAISSVFNRLEPSARSIVLNPGMTRSIPHASGTRLAFNSSCLRVRLRRRRHGGQRHFELTAITNRASCTESKNPAPLAHRPRGSAALASKARVDVQDLHAKPAHTNGPPNWWTDRSKSRHAGPAAAQHDDLRHNQTRLLRK